MNRQIYGYKDIETYNQEDKQTILKDGMIDRSIQLNIQNIDRDIDRQIDGQLDIGMNKLMDGQIYRWKNKWIDIQIDRYQIYRILLRQIEKYADRQIDR